jgi:hypothetical protein
VYKKDKLHEFTIDTLRELYTITLNDSCPDDWGWLPSRNRGFSLCHNSQTCTDTQPLSNPNGGKDFAGNKTVDF